MGRCGSCRAQTQHFCFVHQEFVCAACLTSFTSIHKRCVVNTYRNWVQDSTYTWPPLCRVCGVELDPDGDILRRACLHVEYVACIAKSAAPHACATCDAPLSASLVDGALAEAAAARIRDVPELRYLVPQSEKILDMPNMRVLQSAEEQQPFQRQNAALRIIETDAGSVSQVAPDESRNTPEQRPLSSSAPVLQAPKLEMPPTVSKAETRLQLEAALAPVPSKPLSYKREKPRASSSWWRKTTKAGSRRLFDLRKMLSENRRQVTVLALFVFCVALVAYLMTGDDDVATASRPVVEEVTLPHVRVNPALIPRHGLQGFEPGRRHERLQ